MQPRGSFAAAAVGSWCEKKIEGNNGRERNEGGVYIRKIEIFTSLPGASKEMRVESHLNEIRV